MNCLGMVDNMEKESEDKLVTVATVQGPVEAEIIKSLLKSHGIRCLMRGQVVQSVHAFSADGLGKIKILVMKKNAETAKLLIHDAQEDSSGSVEIE